MENFGKFASVEELVKGYGELEKVFTQKCQQLSALQKQMKNLVDGGDSQIAPFYEKEDNAAAQPSDVQKKGTNFEISPEAAFEATSCGTNAASDQSASPQTTEGTAESVANDSEAATVPSRSENAADGSRVAAVPDPPRVMTGGGNVSMALPNRPKTLREASDLAKKYFN